jgi:hypothetical protein
MRRFFHVGLLCFSLAAALGSTSSRAVAITGLSTAPKPLALGRKLETNAGVVRVSSLVKSGKPTAFVFVGVHCPIANAKSPDLIALNRRYTPLGGRVVLVYSNPSDIDDASEHSKRFGLSVLPRVLDRNRDLADALGVSSTPCAVVVDGSGRVVYRGRIDDSHAGRSKPRGSAPLHRDLEAHMARVLHGDTSFVATAAVGCVLETTPRAPVPNLKTYASDVAPILNKHCVPCHRPGEIGPMPLDTLASARRFADNIASVVAQRTMPPWKPVNKHGQFVGERHLTAAESETLVGWARSGAPAGNMAKAPAKPSFASGWTLGKPDLILKMPAAWTVPAGGADDYRCFVLPTGLTEDKEVVAVEYRAGNKSVVHHVLGFVDTRGEGRRLDAAHPGAGYTSFGGPGFLATGEMGGWAPGNLPQFLPDGIARPLPAGSDLIIQVHYHPIGRPETDITQVGLYFAKKPAKHRLRVLPLIASLDIPAGEANYRTGFQYPLPMDATAIFVVPHMHLLGRKISVDATLPSGTTQSMVRIEDWDFNWQDTYTFREPMRLPKGTKLRIEARFDNSSANPRQPVPIPRRVGWGEATTDEMCVAIVGYIVDNEDDPAVRMFDLMFGGGGRVGKR